MMRFLTNLHIPLPKAFYASAEFVLNGYLRAALQQEEIDPALIRSLLETATLEGVTIDSPTLEFIFRHNLETMAERLAADPTEPRLKQLHNAATVIESLPFGVDIWKIQNIYYALLQTVYPKMQELQARGDEPAQAWVENFSPLGRLLRIKIP
jgi:hypothetical protein